MTHSDITWLMQRIFKYKASWSANKQRRVTLSRCWRRMRSLVSPRRFEKCLVTHLYSRLRIQTRIVLSSRAAWNSCVMKSPGKLHDRREGCLRKRIFITNDSVELSHTCAYVRGRSTIPKRKPVIAFRNADFFSLFFLSIPCIAYRLHEYTYVYNNRSRYYIVNACRFT